MTCAILLDSGPLGKVVHQRSTYEEETSLLEEFARSKGASLLVAEIIENEVKQELVQRNFFKSIKKLRKIRRQQRVVALTTEDRALATSIENRLRREGNQISSEIPSNDGILAAQAINLKLYGSYDEVVILTENVKHILKVVKEGVKVWDYQEIIYMIRNNIEIDVVNVTDLVQV